MWCWDDTVVTYSHSLEPKLNTLVRPPAICSGCHKRWHILISRQEAAVGVDILWIVCVCVCGGEAWQAAPVVVCYVSYPGSSVVWGDAVAFSSHWLFSWVKRPHVCLFCSIYDLHYCTCCLLVSVLVVHTCCVMFIKTWMKTEMLSAIMKRSCFLFSSSVNQNFITAVKQNKVCYSNQLSYITDTCQFEAEWTASWEQMYLKNIMNAFY